MLYLIQRKDGSLDHWWSNKGGADFVDVVIIGEALKNESGQYVDVKCVELVDGKPVINPIKQAQLAKELVDEIEAGKRKLARKIDRAASLEMFRGKDLSTSEVKRAVEILIAERLGD